MGEMHDENGTGEPRPGEVKAGGERQAEKAAEGAPKAEAPVAAETVPAPEAVVEAEAVMAPETVPAAEAGPAAEEVAAAEPEAAVAEAPGASEGSAAAPGGEAVEAPGASEGSAAAPGGEAVEAPAPASPEKLARTRELVEGLLRRLGVEAELEVRDTPEAIACSLKIRSGGELFASGPRGQVLEAAQYLVNKMVNREREAEGRKFVSLELGGFAEPAADPALERMAIRLGEAAKRMGKTLTVVPMPSKDRRAVHVALAGVEGVRTRSEGDGLFRRLLVEPEGR
jgi:spoIIIJ-associated protein